MHLTTPHKRGSDIFGESGKPKLFLNLGLWFANSRSVTSSWTERERAPLVLGRGLGRSWEVVQATSGESHLGPGVTLISNEVFGTMGQKSM